MIKWADGTTGCSSEGRFSKLGLDLELDDDFQVDVGVELDGLALPGEVKLDFSYIENRAQTELGRGNSF